MNRTIEQWKKCDPDAMTNEMSVAAIYYAMRDAREDIITLHEALTEIRDMLEGHPAYAELTEEQETEIGGDTADLSYLVRVANTALMGKST